MISFYHRRNQLGLHLKFRDSSWDVLSLSKVLVMLFALFAMLNLIILIYGRFRGRLKRSSQP